MEFEKILQLIESVSNSELTSFTLEEDGTKLVLEARRGREELQENKNSSVQVVVHEETVDTSENAVTVAGGSGKIINSPLVGTFYAASAPDAAPYVKVGDTVAKGQTLAIVEAMKLMNEIESEYAGVVKEILVSNGAIVEFGQPLFVIG